MDNHYEAARDLIFEESWKCLQETFGIFIHFDKNVALLWLNLF